MITGSSQNGRIHRSTLICSPHAGYEFMLHHHITAAAFSACFKTSTIRLPWIPGGYTYEFERIFDLQRKSLKIFGFWNVLPENGPKVTLERSTTLWFSESILGCYILKAFVTFPWVSKKSFIGPFLCKIQNVSPIYKRTHLVSYICRNFMTTAKWIQKQQWER